MYPKLHSQKHLRFLLAASIFSVILGKCYSQAVPAMFVFGDSLVDAGNNNYLLTLAKADKPPNGIDNGGPTGRWTNGKSIIDMFGQELGFQNTTPPSLAPTAKGQAVLKGVNYASGGSGIMDLTGAIFGCHISVDKQIDDFAKTRQEIISNIGETAAFEMMEKSLFIVTVGSNDLIVNYLNIAPFENMLAAKLFVDGMMEKFRAQLTRLYEFGARKFVVSNVSPIGCMPYMRDHYAATGDYCIQYPNQVAELYNSQLKPLVDELSSKLAGSKFVYVDLYTMVQGIIQNYTSYGFENVNSACCHSAGRFGGLLPCGPLSQVCGDRSKYFFWDFFHPTEATLSIVAKQYLHGGPPMVSPMNMWQLVKS